VKAVVDDSDGLVNAWVGVVFDTDLDKVMRAAIEFGAGGEDSVWVFTDGINAQDINSRGFGGFDNPDNDVELMTALKGAFRMVASGGTETEAGNTLHDR